jgi:hypothetical protein
MCAWVKMTSGGRVAHNEAAVPVASAEDLEILPQLPDRFARHHGNRKSDVDAARARLHRDGQSRIRPLVDEIRHARGFPGEQEDVATGEGEARIGDRSLGRQQHKASRFASAPVLEGVPVDMPGQRRHFEIVHAGPFQRPVGEGEAGWFDDVDAEAEARAEAQDCPGVAGDIRLVEGDAETVVHFRVFLVHDPEKRLMHRFKVSERPLRAHWARGALIRCGSATGVSRFWKFLDWRVVILCEIGYTTGNVNPNRWRGIS